MYYRSIFIDIDIFYQQIKPQPEACGAVEATDLGSDGAGAGGAGGGAGGTDDGNGVSDHPGRSVKWLS